MRRLAKPLRSPDLRQALTDAGATEQQLHEYVASVVDFYMRDASLSADVRLAFIQAVTFEFRVRVTMRSSDVCTALYRITPEVVQ